MMVFTLSWHFHAGFESRIWSSFVCTQCKIHSCMACTNWGVSKWRCSKRASRPVCEPDLRSGISSIPLPLKTWKPSWETTLTAAASPTWVAARAKSIAQNSSKSNFTRLQTQQIRPLRVILYDSPSFSPWQLALSVFLCLTKNTSDPIKKGRIIKGDFSFPQFLYWRAFEKCIKALYFLQNAVLSGIYKAESYNSKHRNAAALCLENYRKMPHFTQLCPQIKVRHF